MKALNMVLAGLGTRGKIWAEVIGRSPDCHLLACADPQEAAQLFARERYGVEHCFGSTEEALAKLSGVDAVILATPPEGREAQVKAVCELGIPLLVEKPLALSLKRAKDYVAMAEAAAIEMMVGLNFRYLGVTQKTLELIKNNIVGQPEAGRFTYERWRDGRLPRLNKYPLSMPQPMLWEQSIHHFDLMRYVYKKKPRTVFCKTWNPAWSMYADDSNVTAIFTFEEGLIVSYQGTWQSAQQHMNFEWRTECSEGIILQKEMFGSLSYAGLHDETPTAVALPEHEPWLSDAANLLAAFVDTVARGRPLEGSGRDHLMSLAMVEACILSSESGSQIEIAPLLGPPS